MKQHPTQGQDHKFVHEIPINISSDCIEYIIIYHQICFTDTFLSVIAFKAPKQVNLQPCYKPNKKRYEEYKNEAFSERLLSYQFTPTKLYEFLTFLGNFISAVLSSPQTNTERKSEYDSILLQKYSQFYIKCKYSILNI